MNEVRETRKPRKSPLHSCYNFVCHSCNYPWSLSACIYMCMCVCVCVCVCAICLYVCICYLYMFLFTMKFIKLTSSTYRDSTVFLTIHVWTVNKGFPIPISDDCKMKFINHKIGPKWIFVLIYCHIHLIGIIITITISSIK